ncbi:hypothetical protein N496_03885 [Clostridium botulinum A2B3 87]|nr:hypothetical protein N496_03885 [Clostridium botulinum A2B3 87]MBN3346579.1 hypothetical protein [Clostridium botulinum]
MFVNHNKVKNLDGLPLEFLVDVKKSLEIIFFILANFFIHMKFIINSSSISFKYSFLFYILLVFN